MTFLNVIRAFLGWGQEPRQAPALPAPQPEPWPAPGGYSPAQVAANDAAVPVEAVSAPDLPLPAPSPVPQAAVDLLHHYEGCRLVPYRDAAGIPTIGWGNTRRLDGTRVQLSDRPITQSEADRLFEFWLSDFDAGVRKFLPYPCPEPVHAAMLCFAYNVGLSAAKGSTATKRLAAGDVAGAAQALTLWNKAGGKVLKGLQRRREAERLVMLGATPDSAIAAAEKAFP
jgi:lysozyme